MTTTTFKNALLSVLLIALSFNAFSQEDDRMKIRLGFTSVNDIHRQLLVTVDRNATAGIDFGYDAETFENHQDDMYWMIDDRRFVIQAVDIIYSETSLPIGLHTGTDGVSTILIDELINVPSDLEIVVYDNVTNTYHNIKDNSGFSIDLPAGVYLDRFELRFADLTPETTEEETNEEEVEVVEEVEAVEEVTVANNQPLNVQFLNTTKNIKVNNLGAQTLNSVEVYTFSGQLKAQFNNFQTTSNKAEDIITIQTNNLNTGNYIIVINTNEGSISKKVAVK